MPDDRKFYHRGGLEYARVSHILGDTMPLFHPSKHRGLQWWQQHNPDAPEILARGQKRGTLIHAEIEIALMGEQFIHQGECPSVEELMFHNIPAYMNYLMPLLNQIKDQNLRDTLWPGLSISPMLIENELFCKHGFAGTPDLRCWFEGKYTVWDWKTVRSIKEEGVQKKPKPMSKYSEAKIQVASYALAHNLELASQPYDYPPIEQCAICICYDWCEPFLYLMPIDEVKESADEFIERFGVYKELENSVFPRPIKQAGE